MYIIYNEDGSIRRMNLTDYIQKGNDNVNSIFLGIKNKTYGSWAATVLFSLPNGTITSTTPTLDSQKIDGVTYYGWKVLIPADVTIYEGEVGISITFINLQDEELFTYKGKLVINPAVSVPEETNINYSQYQSLLQLVLQKPAPLQTFIVVDGFDDVVVSNYDEGQLFYDKQTSLFYILENNPIEEYDEIGSGIEINYATNDEIDRLFD